MPSPSGTESHQADAPAPFRFVQEGPFIEAPSGATITMRTVTWGVAPPDFTRFVGTIMANVQAVDPASGQVRRGQVPIQFGIEAEDIDGAFDRFRACGEQAAQKWLAARNKPELVVPGQVPSSNGQFSVGSDRFNFGGGS